MNIEESYRRPRTITAISVGGFKSFAAEQHVEIRPLTLLAGANSSGKSSLMQPLLLLKQTLEASYDPGPLMLDGPNVRFSNAGQVLARDFESSCVNEFRVGFGINKDNAMTNIFRSNEDQGFDLVQSDLRLSGRAVTLQAGVKDLKASAIDGLAPSLAMTYVFGGDDGSWEVVRSRCFLTVSPQANRYKWVEPTPEAVFGTLLQEVIHVPGLRGNPERSYSTSAVGEYFPGTFENYVASILRSWQKLDRERLGSLDESLKLLGLTSKVRAKPLDATRVELLVGRLPASDEPNEEDLVNIVDVGFGVSQVLPVVVSLLAAQPGQLVYIEQPELHLHPRAQQALASILADAASRGVRVVAETHSSVLLLAVRTLVAQGKLDSDLVKLHWFTRDSRGATQISSADLDNLGAYGDWPVDFGEVEMDADNAYLDAVEAQVFPAKFKNAKG